MKKWMTFSSIFLSMLIFVNVLHFLSTDKRNARKSILLLFRPLITDASTTVTILHYKDERLVNKGTIEYNEEFLRMFPKALYRSVLRKEKPTDISNKLTDYVRVELKNDNSKYVVDFPTNEPSYTFARFTDTERERISIFYLSRRGQQKIRFLLEK